MCGIGAGYLVFRVLRCTPVVQGVHHGLVCGLVGGDVGLAGEE